MYPYLNIPEEHKTKINLPSSIQLATDQVKKENVFLLDFFEYALFCRFNFGITFYVIIQD